MDLRFIETTDALYASECALRYELLRRPLGHAPGSERFDFEDGSLHLVAVQDDQVVGCVLFHPDGAGGGRLFQMAVSGTLQGQGVGAKLVRHLEDRCRADGIVTIELHARKHVSGFYASLGYAPVGDEYLEVGIPHLNMHRVLQKQSLEN
jgi:predicted GNAT family N-acyltransferase